VSRDFLAWANRGEAGKGVLVAGAWINDFVDEVCHFPNAPHDDPVDAFSLAVQMIGMKENIVLAFLANYTLTNNPISTIRCRRKLVLNSLFSSRFYPAFAELHDGFEVNLVTSERYRKKYYFASYLVVNNRFREPTNDAKLY